MKKIVLNLILAVLPLTMMAQLPYGTEMANSHFQDPKVIIASEGTVKWSSIEVGKLDYTGIYLGETVVFGDAKTHAVQIALPTVGLPDELSFSYVSITAKHGTWTVYESSNHSDWSLVRSGSIEAALTKYGESAKLKSSTRYLKFEYVGTAHMLFNAIKVTEKKELFVSTDEFLFPTAKVDATASTKSVKITWTNVTGTISSTNPAFTLSRSTFGKKNEENQSTDVVISYNHENYGTHEGLILFEAEGLKDTVKVSGTTERYTQTLTWKQNLGTYKTTDKVLLQASLSSNQAVVYSLSDTAVAMVNEENFLVAKCAGTVNITASHPGDRKYEPVEPITKSVTFEKANPEISISVSSLVYGQRLNEVELTELYGIVPGTLEFRNIDTDTVFDAGLYTLDVAFVPDDDCIYNEVNRKVQVQVNQASQTITWNQGVTKLYVGDTILLMASASSQLPLTYAFTSCNIDIEDNYLIGVEPGEVLVIAFQEGNKNYLPSTVAKQSFEVLDKPAPVRQITADPSLEELDENGQKYFHNGQLYIYYRGHTYNAEGLRLK